MRSGVPRLLLGFYNSDKTAVGLLPWRRRFQPTAVTGALPLHVRTCTSSVAMVWFLSFADPAPAPVVQPLADTALLLAPPASRALSSFVSFRFVSLRLSTRLLCLSV